VSFPKTIASPHVNLVFSFAPVLQISPNGTTSPKTVLPFLVENFEINESATSPTLPSAFRFL
jgi:hypothetical protein